MQTYEGITYRVTKTVSKVKLRIWSFRLRCFPFQSTFLELRFKIILILTDPYFQVSEIQPIRRDETEQRAWSSRAEADCAFSRRNVTCLL
jgi:hypothetical protein